MGPPLIALFLTTHWPSDPTTDEHTSLESLSTDFIPKKREAIVNVTAASKPISCSVNDRPIERYLSLPKLLKSTAWIIRYTQFCRARKSSTLFSLYLSADKLQYAELALIKYVQLQHFSFFFKLCSSKNPVLAKESLARSLRKLHLMLVDGVLYVGGRLKRAPVDYGNKHPVILPNNLHQTDLFIQKHHLEVGHSGLDILGLRYVSTIG